MIKKFFVFKPIRRMDIQESFFTAIIVTISCLCVFVIHYSSTYQNMVQSLNERVFSIYGYLDDSLDSQAFQQLRTANDMHTDVYQMERQIFANVRRATGVRYLYTATRTNRGEFIYLIDGLPTDAKDFRYPGERIEQDIIPELERAMAGETVMPDDIKDTGWGKIFIAYLPIHEKQSGEVVGVVGIEFGAEAQYNTYRNLRLITPLIIISACILSILLALTLFHRISNPSYRDMSNTDMLTQLKNGNAYKVDAKNQFVRRGVCNVGILLLDLNNLKMVNDVLGHSNGDKYLQIVSEVLSQATHGDQTPYRIGGDEFVVLVPDTSQEQMRSIRDEILAIFTDNKPDWPVDTSLSVGWYVCKPGDSLQTAYDHADRMMYEQKRSYHESEEHDRRGRGPHHKG